MLLRSQHHPTPDHSLWPKYTLPARPISDSILIPSARRQPTRSYFQSRDTSIKTFSELCRSASEAKMVDCTRVKFDVPIGTWGQTQVEVEYPWHRDLDSIILPLLETAHEQQAERQRKHRSEGSMHKSHSKKSHRTSTKTERNDSAVLPMRPNEDIKLYLKGFESARDLTTKRGETFQTVLEQYAQQMEKDVERLELRPDARAGASLLLRLQCGLARMVNLSLSLRSFGFRKYRTSILATGCFLQTDHWQFHRASRSTPNTMMHNSTRQNNTPPRDIRWPQKKHKSFWRISVPCYKESVKIRNHNPQLSNTDVKPATRYKMRAIVARVTAVFDQAAEFAMILWRQKVPLRVASFAAITFRADSLELKAHPLHKLNDPTDHSLDGYSVRIMMHPLVASTDTQEGAQTKSRVSVKATVVLEDVA
ncbi:hypothetical protein BST61_g9803 [Cercospora zeina]